MNVLHSCLVLQRRDRMYPKVIKHSGQRNHNGHFSVLII